MKRLPLLLAGAIALTVGLPAAVVLARNASPPPGVSAGLAPLDSARDEMRVGRYWHGARILRAAGVPASDDPDEILLLARAEAGWKNWAAVGPLLRGRPWLASEAGAEGWLLLGRSLEEGERWADAQAAYAAFLAASRRAHDGRAGAQARSVRVAMAAGDLEGALAALVGLPPPLDSWAALKATGFLAPADTAAAMALLAHVRDRAARVAAWRVLPQARLAAGDTTGAQAAFLAVRAELGGARGAEASTEAGRLALARGDSVAARRLLLEGLEGGPLANRGRAASALLAFLDTEPALTLRMAAVLDRVADHGPALRAYDRADRLAMESGEPLPGDVRLARARLMGLVGSRQGDAVAEFRAILAATPEPRMAARTLEAFAALRTRQKRTSDANTLRNRIVAEHPSSPEAAEILWDRGTSAQSRGDIAGALALYASLSEAAPEHARSGEARMRTGQIQLGRGRVEDAAEVYESYLRDFPTGRRWEEASFWAGRVRMQLGETTAARRILARVRREEPVSYYAVMGAALLGVSYEVSFPEGEPALTPQWLSQGLDRLDLLQEAGLDEGADAEEEDLVVRARGNAGALLTLAEALIQRGRTITGINLAWDLRREGAAWDGRLIRAAYPFPYKELVIREAREWGVDPIMLAAIIRQESAFKADIRSSAGAVGLMQVMPPTGRELARRHGPEGFSETNLEAPEVNLHLGAAFFRDMSRRYDDDLPLVLSAYNAGPTRATRWKSYPEASDPLRFTERIPFDETRNYVKYVRRNLGLYRVLYGAD